MTVKFGPDITYFLWSLAAGIVLAIIYDIVRVIRRMVNAPDLVVNLTDIMFLIFSAVIAIVAAYLFNNGELRVYSLICIAGIFMVYKILIGDLIVKHTVRLLRFAGRTIAKLVLIIIFPLKKIFVTLHNLFKHLSNGILRILKRIFSIIHKNKKSNKR